MPKTKTKLKIAVKTKDGETKSLEVEKSDTIASVLEKSGAASLKFEDKELEKDKKLEDYEVKEGAVLEEPAAAEDSMFDLTKITPTGDATEEEPVSPTRGAPTDEAPSSPKEASSTTNEARFSSMSGFARSSDREDVQIDVAVASRLAAERGLPAELPAEEVKSFLLQYGFSCEDDKTWSNKDRPKVQIVLNQHKEFGDTTQYEIKCECVDAADAMSKTWVTLRRLKYLREGLHDAVKSSISTQEYKEHFGKTPFAHTGGPPGTSKRLSAWFESMASAMTSGALSPAITCKVFRVLDGPGTPLYVSRYEKDKHLLRHHAQASFPITASVFGQRNWCFEKE